MVDIAALFKRPSFLLKIVELVFAVICTALVAGDVQVGGPDLNKTAVIYVTIIGFIMINVIVLMSYFLDTPMNKLLLMIIAAVGFIMFLTAGALMCDTYAVSKFNKNGRLLGSGIMAIFASFVYAADAAATYFEQVD